MHSNDLDNSARATDKINVGAAANLKLDPMEQEVLRTVTDEKFTRLVDWNTSVLLDRLKAIEAHRNKEAGLGGKESVIDAEVVSQLRSYVVGVAAMYNDNPFHNFEVRKCAPC